MATTYEMAFMAIASKNSFLTHEEAAQCLTEYQSQLAIGPRRSIEEIASEKGLLTEKQIQIISSATARVMAQRAASTAPAPAPQAPAKPSSTSRIPTTAAPASPAGPAKPNEPIPGVRIINKLGVGGTATVFLAEDVNHGRKVALKIIHPSLAKDEKAVRRFQREAGLLCSFDHTNLVKGYSQGMMGPLSYLLMEYLDGESLQEVLDRQKHLSEAQGLEIILETAKAIDHMQSRGIIHRDIKPGNIFLCRDGSVKVIDLGFAQEIQGGDSGEEETTSGTVQYMSPEQARGQRDLDVRADIYSLGATLYHIVMGELPFSGGDSLEVMAKQVMEALNSSEIKNRRVSKHMHYFIERMMSKDKDLRYSTPHELVEDITEQIEGFKSLEYRPEGGEEATSSTVMDLVKRPDEPPPAGPSTTRRLRPLAPETR
ncbi:MAG TPA: serine/threonine-protein kinase, partial [Planctomycetota bacterium]|nr:serine/threonine-protein kinase [Planctomycetota bacterium]